MDGWMDGMVRTTSCGRWVVPDSANRGRTTWQPNTPAWKSCKRGRELAKGRRGRLHRRTWHLFCDGDPLQSWGCHGCFQRGVLSTVKMWDRGPGHADPLWRAWVCARVFLCSVCVCVGPGVSSLLFPLSAGCHHNLGMLLCTNMSMSPAQLPAWAPFQQTHRTRR